MTARFSTGQRDPQIPKDDRLTIGKLMWYIAPIRPVRQTKNAAIVYPTQTQIHACHQDSPSVKDEAAIIHVLILNESAIQKATKLICLHCRLSGSTGFKSWLVRNSCLFVKPGSTSHSYQIVSRNRHVEGWLSAPASRSIFYEAFRAWASLQTTT